MVKVNAIITEKLRREIRAMSEQNDTSIQSMVELCLAVGLEHVRRTPEAIKRLRPPVKTGRPAQK